jgi:hypothetical protein
MPFHRVVLSAFLVCSASVAFADGIEPGMWKIVSQVETGGALNPPQQSVKCLTAEQTGDLAVTFSPVQRTINSECQPIERSLVGGKLTWKLVCKGQLDMELTGDFVFDNPHHYSAVVQSKAVMAGMPMGASRTSIDAQWVSACEEPPPAVR